MSGFKEGEVVLYGGMIYTIKEVYVRSLKLDLYPGYGKDRGDTFIRIPMVRVSHIPKKLQGCL